MFQNHSRHDYHATIALAAFVLLAFVILAALLVPGAIPLVVVLPALRIFAFGDHFYQRWFRFRDTLYFPTRRRCTLTMVHNLHAQFREYS